jgi:hypothetical protein
LGHGISKLGSFPSEKEWIRALIMGNSNILMLSLSLSSFSVMFLSVNF